MNDTHRIAIVGTGPAGMYACEHLLENRDIDVEVDLFERLPTPWGLVRAGVAPDHPEKKRVVDRLFDYFLRHEKVRLLANVDVGKDISHEELAKRYDGVIYAVGAGGDKTLNIPGSGLPGCLTAREFVAWYNGHPDFRDCPVDLDHERAVIVGNGNVALDVARILTLPIAELEATDIAEHALEKLRSSQIQEVVVLGRRSQREAAFNNPELEEFLQLDSVAVSVENGSDTGSSETDWVTRRKLSTLKSLSQRRLPNADKRIVFRFLTSPAEILGVDKVEQLELAMNELIPDESGGLRAQPTGEVSRLDAGLVLLAAGYRGLPQDALPFDDQRGVISNEGGRVVDGAGKPLERSYVTGWIKRGPQGIIGSNKKCARETVNALLEDIHTAAGSVSGPHDDILEVLRQLEVKVLSREDWLKIDRAEREAGARQGRPRVKFTEKDEMLAVAAAR